MKNLTFGALLAASLGIVVGGIVVGGVTTVTAANQPDEWDDTYVHQVGTIRTHGGGQICADKLRPNVNRVTITQATLFNETFFHYDTGKDVRIQVPKLHADKIVLYTNGSNPIVNKLAAAHACTPPDADVTCSLTLDEYQIATSVEMPKGISLLAGSHVADDPPRPNDNVNTSRIDECLGFVPGGNTSSDASGTLPPDVGDDAIDNATDRVNGTVDNTTDRVNDTVENTTDRVNDTVDDTTDQVNDTVDNTTDQVNETTSPIKRVVNETVSDVKDPVDDTADMVEKVVNGANGTESGTTDEPVDTASGTTPTPGTPEARGDGGIPNVVWLVSAVGQLLVPLVGSVVLLGQRTV